MQFAVTLNRQSADWSFVVPAFLLTWPTGWLGGGFATWKTRPPPTPFPPPRLGPLVCNVCGLVVVVYFDSKGVQLVSTQGVDDCLTRTSKKRTTNLYTPL